MQRRDFILQTMGVAAASLLVGMDYEPGWIKTERFGATGG